MAKQTAWIVTGALGIAALGTSAAFASNNEPAADLGPGVELSDTNEREGAVVTISSRMSSVTPVSVASTMSPQSPNTVASSPSPVSTQSAASQPSPASAPSPVSPVSAQSPQSADSPASAESAD